MLKVIPLEFPEIKETAEKLAPTGQLRQVDGLVYLNIDNDYIHRLFPLIENTQFLKPDYFSPNKIGAHVSVIYPEENILCGSDDLDRVHGFKIKNVCSATLNERNYFILTVASESLFHIREKYELPKMPIFKGYSVDFHITIGVY